MKHTFSLYDKIKPQGSIFHKTLISHISILLLSIFMCSFYYVHTYIALKEYSSANQRLFLENAKEQLNYVFYDSITLSNTLMLNRYVGPLSHDHSFLTKNPVLERHYLSEELRAFTSSNSLIEGITLYFPASDYIVSSASSHPAHLLDSMENHLLGYGKLQTLYHTLSPDSFYCFLSESGNNLLLAHPLITSHDGETLSLSILQIDKQNLSRRLQNNIPFESGSSFALIDPESVLFSTGTDVALDDIPGIWEYFQGHRNASLKIRLKPSNARYIIDYYPTLISGTGLISITRQSVYHTALYRLLLVLGITLLVCIATGVTFIYYYSRKSYRPIAQILRFMGKEGIDGKESDEYRMILNMLSQNRSEIEYQKELLKNNYLQKILTGELPFSQITSQISTEFSLLFPLPFSCIASLRINAENDAKYDQLLTFIVQNVLGELLTEHFPGHYFCSRNDQIIVLVNMPAKYGTDPSPGIREIEKILGKFIVFLEKHYGLDFFAGISQILPNHSIPAAYLQAESTSEYLNLFKPDKVMCFDEIPAQKEHTTIYLKTQDFVLNLLFNSSPENLDAYFKPICQNILCNNLSRTDSKSCFYFFYLTTLQVRNSCQEQYGFTPLSLDFIDNNYFSLSLSDALHQTHMGYAAFMKELSAQKETHQENNWGLDICRYIENNYFDVNLNLNTVAEYFSITPSYLSRKFKDKYNRSINDYLYEVRIDHAKKLINNTNLKVGEIAQITGFMDSNAFIRIFKKYTGTTPGKYKSRP